MDCLEINRVVYNEFVRLNLKNRNDMNYALTELKEQWPILRQYHSKMLQMISTKISAAWKGMKTLQDNGHKVGNKLHFLFDIQCNAFTYNQSGYRIEQLLDGNNRAVLHLSKIGAIEIRVHRKFEKIKQITVIRQAGKWFAILTCNTSRIIKQTHEKPVGIDVGIINYTYDSDGGRADNPAFMKKDIGKIRRSNKRISRRVLGSNNYYKSLCWHQRLQQRITNKRRNFLHNLSNQYAKKYDIVFVEKLNLTGMLKNRYFARHILDSAWGTFTSLLKYKVNTIEVSSKNTTIDCSRCGEHVPKTLAIRIHECPRCGVVLDRDHNAALNILQRGLKSLNLPKQLGEVKPVETLRRVDETGINPRLCVDS